MQPMTLFLTQLLGPVLILLGISFFTKQHEYNKLFKKLHKENAFLFLEGIVETTAGLAIVLSHNMWGTLPEIVISAFGWAMVAEGSLVLLTKNRSIKKSLRAISDPALMMTFSVSFLILGAYLTWVGFLA